MKVVRPALEVANMGIVCMVCGRNLGNVVYVPGLSDWNHLDYLPVCNDCFNRFGLPMVKPADMQFPHQSKRV